MPFEGGPFIQAACFCETAIQENNGTLSLIRIIDTIHTSASGPNPPMDLNPFPYRLKLVIMLKSGAARGRNEIRIVPEIPNGSTKEPIYFTVHFEGEEKGFNLIVDVNFMFELEGLYWFNIYLEDQKMTAIPIRVLYNRVVTKTSVLP